MAATPPAPAGKPENDFVHVRNSRDVQVSSLSPTPMIEGPSHGTLLVNEHVHHTHSAVQNAPLCISEHNNHNIRGTIIVALVAKHA